MKILTTGYKKQFSYKGYTFDYHYESDPCFTWTIVTLNGNSVYYGMNFEVAGDGLADAKWLATRKLNELINKQLNSKTWNYTTSYQ